MLRLAPFLLLLLPACRGVYAPDVAERFEQDFRKVRLRIPDKADLNPARAAAGDMAGTIAIGRKYLDRDKSSSMHTRYVRALLACGHQKFCSKVNKLLFVGQPVAIEIFECIDRVVRIQAIGQFHIVGEPASSCPGRALR